MITIDIRSRIPIYEQIYKSVCSDIARGVLKEDDKLPGARTLAKELGLNPNTVAKAYSMLEHDGIIYSAAGRGCFVAKTSDGGAHKRLENELKSKLREALDGGITHERITELLDEVQNEK
ncbi:MAG: GntR family transcriptional regulator [Ruminococcus sp.]|nr:GntR family transcriptional regulator [Ruminococcus sp.]